MNPLDAQVPIDWHGTTKRLRDLTAPQLRHLAAMLDATATAVTQGWRDAPALVHLDPDNITTAELQARAHDLRTAAAGLDLKQALLHE